MKLLGVEGVGVHRKLGPLFLITLVLSSFVVQSSLTIVTGQQGSASIITEFQIPTGNSGPEAIISGPNQTFWFTEFNAGKIGELFGQNGTIHDFKANATVVEPDSLAVDRQGRIWFSDPSGRGSIWMFNPNTIVFRRFNTTTANSFPLSIFMDAANNTWFTEVTGNKIGEIIYPSNTMVEYPLPSLDSGPAEISYQNGTSLLWISESYAGKVSRFNMTDHTFQEFTPSQPVSSPLGIVLDRAHNVWIAEHGGSSIDEFFPSNSSLRKYPTSPPTGGYSFTAPATLALDKKGRFWFMEHLADRVGRLDPASNTLDEFNIPTSGSYSVLNTVDQSGNFWFTQYAANEIGMVPGNSVGQPQNSRSIVDLIASYLPEILVAAAGILGVTYLALRRKRSRGDLAGNRGSVAAACVSLATIMTAASLILSLLSVDVATPLAKCIGAPPPNNGGTGGSAGLDYFSIALEVGSLAFFALIAYLLWRDRRRSKGAPQLPK
jgi:virginiamycin B lyase